MVIHDSHFSILKQIKLSRDTLSDHLESINSTNQLVFCNSSSKQFVLFKIKIGNHKFDQVERYCLLAWHYHDSKSWTYIHFYKAVSNLKMQYPVLRWLSCFHDSHSVINESSVLIFFMEMFVCLGRGGCLVLIMSRYTRMEGWLF